MTPILAPIDLPIRELRSSAIYSDTTWKRELGSSGCHDTDLKFIISLSRPTHTYSINLDTLSITMSTQRKKSFKSRHERLSRADKAKHGDGSARYKQ